MKMEGDPHVTAWGVMRDMITPQQVVGGLFLMNAEEKPCVTLQPRLEILEEQGELMSAPHPLLSQHDEPLLGAGEGQQPGAEPWTGQGGGRLTLCTLNLSPPDSAQIPPIYKPSTDDQMPPLIIAPSDDAHLPLCPAPFSQESEQNLEVDVPQSDVHSLLIPDHTSDQEDLGSALDSHQVSEPMNSLSSVTSDLHQGSGLLLQNDQITPLESFLPLKTDLPCSDGPLLDPNVEALPQLQPSYMVDMIQELPRPDLVQLPDTNFVPCLVSDPIQVSQTESGPKLLTPSKSFVDASLYSCVVPGLDQLPEGVFNLDLDTISQPESDLDLDLDQLPQTEATLHHTIDQLSTANPIIDHQSLSYPYLEPDPAELTQVGLDSKLIPLSESFDATKVLSQSISNLDPDVEEVAQCEPYFDPVTEHIPGSEIDSCLTPCPPETSLVDTAASELSPSPDISVTTELITHTRTFLETNNDPFPINDQLCNQESLQQSQSSGEHVLDPLEYFCPEKIRSETHLDTNELFDSSTPSHLHHCIDLDIYTYNLSESFMAHDTEQSLSLLAPTIDPHTQTVLDSNLPDPNPGQDLLQEELPYASSNTVLLAHCELSLDVDQNSNCGSVLDPDPDQLPWFELSMCSSTSHLPFPMLHEGESSLADELSLCDPFLSPDHYEMTLSISSTCNDHLTSGDKYLEPDDRQTPTSESTDMGHKALTGSLMALNLEGLQQSEAVSKRLLQSNSLLDQETELISEKIMDPDIEPKPEPSGPLDTEPLTLIQSNFTNDCMELNDGPQSCLTDDDLFLLSETFLTHDLDQVTSVDNLVTPESDPLPSSEPCLKPDGDQTCKPLNDDRLSHPESSQSPQTNQLSNPECPLSHKDQLPQSPSFSDSEDPENKFPQCEFPLSPDSDQLSHLESSLCQADELLPQFDTKPSLADHSVSFSDEGVGSDNDELSQFDAPLYPISDLVAQTECDLVPNGDMLPKFETHLGLKTEEVSQSESDSENPLLVPHSDLITSSEASVHHCPLSETPDTTQPNVFESSGVPDQIQVALSCPTSDVSPLDCDADPLCSIEYLFLEPSLTSESLVATNLDMLHLEESTVCSHTEETPLTESLLAPSTDHFQLLESTVPPTTTQLPPSDLSATHSAMPNPLFHQLSPTTLHFSVKETPETPHNICVPLDESSIKPDTPSDTNTTPEDSKFPWDWTLNLHPSLSTEPPQNSAKQQDKSEDCFSIFCLDTPPDSNHATPEADLTLSDDLLSLSDVFSHLQANDVINSPSELDNDQTDCNGEDNQFLNVVFEKDLDSKSPSNPNTVHNASPPLDSDDQSDFYCLDLLFEPSRIYQEMEYLTSEPLLQPKLPLISTEALLDLSWLFSESQICGNGLPAVETYVASNNSDESLSSHSDSPLITSQFGQSSPQLVIDLDSSSLESLSEGAQVPVIVVTDPLEYSDLVDPTDDSPDTNALPLDRSMSAELESDAPAQVVEVTSCEMEDLPELKPDTSDVNHLPEDRLNSSHPSHQLQPDPILEATLPSFMSTGELPLPHMGLPFEGIKLRSRDSQDSASALLPFGEGDPFLAFSLDNDSPCGGDELARLRAVFDALDRDKDGFVKMEDFVQFATVYGAEQVKYLTGYLDPAGLGVINFRDFYRGISEIQNEDLDMQLYDMGYPSEEEPACSVDFDDLAAFEVTEVTDSAYVGSESAYSECETFTDEDTGGLAAQEDPETEGDGAGPRGHAPAIPEGLELSLCDISGVTVTGQEEQFEDFGEGAEPDLFNSHCEEEQESFTQTTDTSLRLTSSPDKRTSSRKEARRLHHSGFLEDPGEQPLTHMACDDTDLTDKVLYLEQRVSELERDAATTAEQQNRLRQENLQLLHRVHALEEQLKDQELQSDEVQSEETRKHRDEIRKMERDRSFRLSSLKARVQELESENTELRSQLPSAKATAQRLEEEKLKLLDEVEELQQQLKDHQEQNNKLGGKLSKEMHKQQLEKERCQEVIEELRRELEQTQLLRLEMEQRMGLGNSAALQEYNSRTREAELEHEVRRLKQEQRILKEQNEELNGQIINLSIQGAKNLFSTTFSDSLAAEISSVSRDELMEAIQKQEEINLRLQDYIDRIIVAIMETNPAILEVKMH
ncbi:rab11 family-interacting protein 3 isoform X2 [Engystomops pustulosus]|uniref:rab11 family-interacting protein 3 isoform X2 n=1 Tax=Engystomops pustulosus TaxID=76066 RepID=UPI003AFAC05D